MQNTGSQETSKRGARCLGLQVLFVAAGGGGPAQLAARWTNLLAHGCLAVKAAARGGADLTAAFNGTPADLVVVIHTPGDPGLRVAYHCGGRIDWDLDVDGTESPVELASEVRRHVMRLLGDLGMPQAHSDRPATPSPRPPTLPVPTRRDARRVFACSVRKAA
jgi:hypothetical protein